jgi:hypothetical protein
MSLTFEINDSRFRHQLARFVDELGLEAKDVVKDQTRLLLKTVIAFTAPKSLAQGRKAVARDINRSMTPIDYTWFRDRRLADRLHTLEQRGDAQGAQDTLRAIGGWGAWRVLPFSPSLHTSARDNRGRVTRTQRTFVLQPESRNSRGAIAIGPWSKYVATVQKRVGQLKAAWAPAYFAVGGTLPAWIANQSYIRGSVDVKFSDPQRPSIEFRNFAKGVGQLRHFFEGAFRTRAEAMRRDIARRLKIASKNAGFR